jgi:hypothetical protein
MWHPRRKGLTVSGTALLQFFCFDLSGFETSFLFPKYGRSPTLEGVCQAS